MIMSVTLLFFYDQVTFQTIFIIINNFYLLLILTIIESFSGE